MGKRTLVVAIVVSFVTSLYLFFSSNRQSPQDVLAESADEAPRVILEKFLLRRAEGVIPRAELTAELGQFKDPNRLEMFGNVRAFRYRGTSQENVFSDSAVAILKSRGINDLVNNAAVDTVTLKDHVLARVSDHELSTEYAEYQADKDLVTSDVPVGVSGPNRWITGDSGFEYQLEKQILTLDGQIKGVVVPDD